MRSEAKVGLGIVLGAVLLSALLIGRAITYKDRNGASPGDAVGQAGGDGSTAHLQLPDVPEDTASGGPTDGDAMDRLVRGGPDAAPPADASEGGTVTPPAPDDGADPLAVAPGVDVSGAGNEAAPVPLSAVTGRNDPRALVGGGEDVTPPLSSTSAPPAPAPVSDTPVVEDRADGASRRDFAYTVQENDSAWKISKRFYNNGKYWKKIVDANPRVDFDNLQVGQQLTIPGKVEEAAGQPAVAPAAAAAPALPAGVREVVVAAGDSPYRLAEKYLHNGMRYTEILKLNPGLDPRTMRVGQKIRIPAQ